MYDGSKAYANGDRNKDRNIGQLLWNSYYNDTKYVGYMLGGQNGASSTTDEEAFVNETSSSIKIYLDNWYKNNILNKNFDNYIADTLFCNDRSSSLLNRPNNRIYYFAAYDRVIDNKAPQFTCPRKQDAFTKDDVAMGNGKLDYKIGLVTIDEVVAAGGKNHRGNNKYYLSQYDYTHTMTPSSGFERFVLSNGLITDGYRSSKLWVSPVINLTPDAILSFEGTGSMTDPFRLLGDSV